MEIIITESQTDKLIERILESEGITYTMKYFGRTYGWSGADKHYDHVIFRFYYPNGGQLERKISFVTNEDEILKFAGSDVFSKKIDELKYIPSDVVTDYFAKKAITFLKKTLSKDNLKESVIKEESLSTMLLNRIKDDGWADTSKLVGGNMNLLNIIGSNKENIISFFLSHYNNLHIEKRGGEILLWDGGLPLLHKSSTLFNSDLRAYDDYLATRLNNDLYGLYVHYRKDLIKELVSRFPELNSKEVNVYKDSGLYQKFDTFYL